MDKMKKVAKEEVKAHEKRMHAAKMAKGGKTNMQMKTMGRNLAKVANQKKTVRSVTKNMGKVNKNG